MSCTIDSGRITPCEGLEQTLEDAYGRGVRSRGLVMRYMVSTKTHEFSRNLVCVKSGEHGKNGLIANFCPFCGGKLVVEDTAP